MIAPRAPLLWCIGLWIAPLNLGLVLAPDRSAAWILAMLPAFAIAAADAFLVRNRLAGLSLEWAGPGRFTLGRESRMKALLRKTGPRPVKASLWIELPSLLAPLPAALVVRMAGHQTQMEIDLAIRPVARGKAPLGPYRFRTRSPLGFWTLRREGTAEAEVKVYPELFARNARFASPENHGRHGAHRGLRPGKGWEIEKLREYLHGDDFHDIHWKATARKGFPVTKVFQVEDTQQVYVVLDISRFCTIPFRTGPAYRSVNSSVNSPASGAARGPETGARALPLEYQIRTALRLGLAAERQNDYYGLMLYGERPGTFLRAGKGKAHFSRFRDALFDVHGQPGSPDYPELFTALRLRLGKRALLLFLCDLGDPAQAESFTEHIGQLSRQHLVSVNMIRPPGLGPLFDRRPVSTPDDIYARLADQIRLQDLARLGRSLARQGVAFHAWDADRLSGEAISQYLRAKRRQALA